MSDRIFAKRLNWSRKTMRKMSPTAPKMGIKVAKTNFHFV
jgi:hypothetical protein